jgi:SAM-dependent methyltransferase
VRLRALIRALRRGRRPVWLGSLGSTTPLSPDWGYARGTPVDRWYIDAFLRRHRQDITGRVLEVKDSGYTDKYGDGVVERAVLDVDPGNELATYVADLADGGGLPSESYDCFVLTQTLQYIFDVRSAVATAHRLLLPGGVLLATVPVTSRVTEPPLTDYWRFTPASVKALLGDVFGAGAVAVSAPGNVLAQIAFLEGMAAEDLDDLELEAADDRFPLIVCARAVRSG